LPGEQRPKRGAPDQPGAPPRGSDRELGVPEGSAGSRALERTSERARERKRPREWKRSSERPSERPSGGQALLAGADRRRRRGRIRRTAQRVRADEGDDRGGGRGGPFRGPAFLREEVRPPRGQGAR